MRESYLENDYAEIWIEDGIVFNIYKPNLVLTLDVAKLLVEDRLKVSNGVSRPLFADISELVSVDRNARRYLSREGGKLVDAGAFLVTSPISKFAGNIFMKIDKPSVPMRLFTSKERAIDWLKSSSRGDK